MKRAIFIDANIYLGFYNTNKSEFKKLLDAIVEAKENVFVTKQISSEVHRNKLKIFLSSFVGYINQFSSPKFILPEHLETKADQEIKEWNKITQQLSKAFKKQAEELEKITTKYILKIQNGTDEVSKSLSKVFEFAEDANESNIDAARERKEIGNPPGKVNDPLGDQLSWEQLLDKVYEIDELWIITNDSDYLLEFNKCRYLNPLLLQELKDENNKIKVHCFNTLSEGLFNFNSTSKIKISALPKEKELTEITKEEKKEEGIDNGYNLSDKYFPNKLHGGLVIKCTRCGYTYLNPRISPNLFSSGVTSGSNYANNMCPSCGQFSFL